MLLSALRNSARYRTSFPKIRNSLSRPSSSISDTKHPNPPLHLDPSLRALLQDVDISLNQHKHKHAYARPGPRELEATSVDILPGEDGALATGDDDVEEHSHRKSPAALFGSQGIGAVILPLELQASINLIISESDKHRLHQDAKRLFLDNGGELSAEDGWEAAYDTKYRSRKQAARHHERDGTAFVSVALPAHFSAISAVFNHVKRRLEPEWRVERVIDWGAGTGSALWASLYAFQNSSDFDMASNPEDLKIANSSVISYTGIDKREGLVAMGKRLFKNLDLGSLSLSWQKSFKEEDKLGRSRGHDTLAISAFMLTSLPTPLARKNLVKEMWESGAHTIVLIDHNTPEGFENIAEAREHLLNVGRKEFDDPLAEEWPIRGCHVVAPCPHDATCPLHHGGSSRLVCGFSQRLQRPSFVRLTKHSGTGHEDIEYSYIVIRRGPRPVPPATKVGRVGEIGKRELEKLAKPPPKELSLHDGEEDSALNENMALDMEEPVGGIDGIEPSSRKDLEAALRQEAYDWPRLVFPPLKKSGHIILDGCTSEGKIMRMTIPKSQGKQPFYDARKSGWGDIFPHEPKNPPQERSLPKRSRRMGPIKGADIGKRGKTKSKPNPGYDGLANALKEDKRQARRNRLDRLASIREKDL
ncbi:hypothetical protein HGRIS_008465 [Hohenbuehelia grisea]|uniref:Rsm22-domain-containing protein n=1 Tax=Hohenbuehelia grisea TaxID=104357 RepID=A0ABR3J813_9AGAR